MFREFVPAIRATAILTLLTGLVYPGVVTALCRLFFPERAEGSLIRVDGKIVGSELIGQKFTGPQYFHGRPSAAGDGYDASNSGGSGLGPTSRVLANRLAADVARFKKENPHHAGSIPADLLTASGSGLDPHISPASADVQVARVAAARNIPEDQIRKVVRACTEGRQMGIFGEPRVNVLKLNLGLDQMRTVSSSGLSVSSGVHDAQ